MYDENPFWWNTEAKRFSMGVFDVSYYADNKRITNLKRPMELLCAVKNIKPNIIEGTVSVPTDLKRWVPKMLDYNITVHRVDVRKGSGLFIEFHDLSENDKIKVKQCNVCRRFSIYSRFLLL